MNKNVLKEKEKILETLMEDNDDDDILKSSVITWGNRNKKANQKKEPPKKYTMDNLLKDSKNEERYEEIEDMIIEVPTSDNDIEHDEKLSKFFSESQYKLQSINAYQRILTFELDIKFEYKKSSKCKITHKYNEMSLDDLICGEFHLISFNKKYPTDLLKWLFDCVCFANPEHSIQALNLWEYILKGEKSNDYILGQNYNTACIYNSKSQFLTLEWIPDLKSFVSQLEIWHFSVDSLIEDDLLRQVEDSADESSSKDIENEKMRSFPLEKYLERKFPFTNLSSFFEIVLSFDRISILKIFQRKHF